MAAQASRIDAPVLGERVGVPLGAELVQELRRALDVGEEEGDRARGEIAPHVARSCAAVAQMSRSLAQAEVADWRGATPIRRSEMAADEVAPARAVWRFGDYHRFAREQIWEIGPVVVEACGISAGQRVLDVAAGTGAPDGSAEYPYEYVLVVARKRSDG